MARISTTEATQALVTTGWTYIALFTSDPGTTGATGEIAGTRTLVGTWTVASGSATNATAISINLIASTTASYFGIFSASTGGTYYIGGALSPAVTTGTSAGVVTISAGSLAITAS